MSSWGMRPYLSCLRMPRTQHKHWHRIGAWEMDEWRKETGRERRVINPYIWMFYCGLHSTLVKADFSPDIPIFLYMSPFWHPWVILPTKSYWFFFPVFLPSVPLFPFSVLSLKSKPLSQLHCLAAVAHRQIFLPISPHSCLLPTVAKQRENPSSPLIQEIYSTSRNLCYAVHQRCAQRLLFKSVSHSTIIVRNQRWSTLQSKDSGISKFWFINLME